MKVIICSTILSTFCMMICIREIVHIIVLLETEHLSFESSKENSMLYLFEFHCQKEICDRMFWVGG